MSGLSMSNLQVLINSTCKIESNYNISFEVFCKKKQHNLPMHTAKYLTWITHEVVMIKDHKKNQSDVAKALVLRQTGLRKQNKARFEGRRGYENETKQGSKTIRKLVFIDNQVCNSYFVRPSTVISSII